MTKDAPDDLEAVRAVVAALADFAAPEQERILRWAREKLGLPAGQGAVSTHVRAATDAAPTPGPPPTPTRMSRPAQTLINAHQQGLLDKGAERGTYVINSVGENLVAMALPGGTGTVSKPSKRRAPRQASKTQTRGRSATAARKRR